MPDFAFWDESVPENLELLRLQPSEVRGVVGVVPEHRDTEVLLGPGPLDGSDDGEEQAARSEPPVQTREQHALILERDMDEGVEAHDRVEGGGREVDDGQVLTCERPARDELAGSADLHLREVDPGDIEAGIHQPSVGRNPSSAAEIEHRGPVIEVGGQLHQPRHIERRRLSTVRRRLSVVAPIDARDRVVAAANEVAPRGTLGSGIGHRDSMAQDARQLATSSRAERCDLRRRDGKEQTSPWRWVMPWHDPVVATRALLLDSGGVLIRPLDGVWFPPPVFAEVLGERGLVWDGDVLPAALEVGMALLDGAHGQPLADEAAEIELFTRYHESVLSELGLPVELGAEIAARSARSLPVETYEWTVPVLTEARRRGTTVVIVSDAWPSLRRFYRMLDLDHLVHGMVISAELGCTKPDPRMYHRALELADCSPDEAIFVDDWPGCVAGAEEVGIRGFCLATNPVETYGGSTAVLDDLREVLAYL